MKVIYLEEAVDRFIEQGANLDKDQIIYILNRLPYMEIVRCKDCKWYENACTFFAADPFEQAPMKKNDFCSYGERREE